MGKEPSPGSQNDVSFAFGLSAEMADRTVTARKAGELTDLMLCISPTQKSPAVALKNLAKAMNLAIQDDFLETPLDRVYRVARVKDGSVRILHKDYIGLGDGVFAAIGKTAQSFRLTLQGPDPASPEGQQWIKEHGGGPLGGILNLVGRKLNLLQEFEDKVPAFVEQTLDRLEARGVITHWNRDEWEITTTLIGLEIVIKPAVTTES